MTGHRDCYDYFDMQLIGNFLSFASRGDRVGLNQMLLDGTPPNVQDYDKRTALHLAASEGHAPIVELLIHYKANVNLKDRWQRTPLTDARLYGHRDICRILEVNGGKEFIDDHNSMAFLHEQDSDDVNIDISELILHNSSKINQGANDDSEKVKWRGTWVVKTVIKRQVPQPVKMVLSAKDNTLLRELRHPNILQFLGSIVHGAEMILITEYLPKGSLYNIITDEVRLELPIALRYALDIAKGMNYLHEHKPFPIVHYHLDSRNLLLDEGGQLKVGEYWVHMLNEQIRPNQDSCQRNETSGVNPRDDTKIDLYSFGVIFYQMLEGRSQPKNTNSSSSHSKHVAFQPKFQFSKCPTRIQQLIADCTNQDPSGRPLFSAVIRILDEVCLRLGRTACPVC